MLNKTRQLISSKIFLSSCLIIFFSIGFFLFFNNQTQAVSTNVTLEGTVVNNLCNCQTDDDCAGDLICKNCACVIPGVPPTCLGCTVPDGGWGACVNNVQTGSGFNSCGLPCTTNQSCFVGCGDNFIDVNTNEQCDDGLSGNGVVCLPAYGATCTYCSTQCQKVDVQGGFCGDGVVNGDEICDPNGDANCTSDCHLIAGCGNGVKEADEQCDDGNSSPYDGCDTTNVTGHGICANTFCGDGYTQSIKGEQCDDGNNISGDGCSASCEFEGCGNGVKEGQEQCDEGLNNGQICRADYGSSCVYCSVECQNVTVEGGFCGDGIKNGFEGCDWAAGDPNCLADCRLISCGNGKVDPGEECDPPGIGCTQTCINELVITSFNVFNITKTSATVAWQTNLDSISSLSWQETATGQGAGSVDSLNGTNFSYTINNLSPGTRYSYTIDAQRSVSPFDTDNKSGTFYTISIAVCGDKVCNGDETTETCPIDCPPFCNPEWSVGPWGQCVGGVQSRQVFNLKPECPGIDPPPDQRCCLAGCTITCGVCQQLNVDTQSCDAIYPCCGDRICEATENVETCSLDCGIPPTYHLNLTECLDGQDNDGDGLVDYPADPGCLSPSDDSELSFAEILKNIFDILNSPFVEFINEKVAAPAIILLALVNSFASFSLFNFLTYLRYLITQPLAVFGRRKRKKWGVVYNSLSKRPIDLAIVRLFIKENGQLVQSRVTDKAGRFSFLAAPGNYYLTVTKPKHTFPSQYLKNKREDVKYLDLYHGETVNITDQNANIVVNIPIDPQEDTRTPRKIIFQYYARKVQYTFAFSAVPLAALSLAISPSLFTASLLCLHILLYIFFRRLGYQKKPKSWGVVYDKRDKNPVGLAIARIYDKQYNKLLESRVTDSKGRYAFLVDNNVYTVTAEKSGYQQSKIDEINLVEKKQEAIVDMNIAMEKGQVVVAPTVPVSGQAVPTITPQGTSEQKAEIPVAVKPADEIQIEKTISEVESQVNRQSLEELMKAKQKVKEAETQIDQKQAELEKLEDKAQAVEKQLDNKIKFGKESEEKPSETSAQVKSSQPALVTLTGQPARLKPTTQAQLQKVKPAKKPTEPKKSETKPSQTEPKKSNPDHKPSIFG